MSDYVTRDPVLGLVVVGSKVPVRRLWFWRTRGVTVGMLLNRYHQLGPARVLGALAYAYDHTEIIEAELAADRALLAPPSTPRSSPSGAGRE